MDTAGKRDSEKNISKKGTIFCFSFVYNDVTGKTKKNRFPRHEKTRSRRKKKNK